MLLEITHKTELSKYIVYMASVNEMLPQHESWRPSTKIPSYLNIKEIKIELKAFLSNKYARKKAGTSNSSKGIHSC